MAVHKVPQDVEADDKFLGPLSFKQFLFFGGFAICGYLSFLTLTKVWPVSFIFIIPTLAFGALAFPWSKEQPTELFLASRIRFLIKPRKRIWNQSGVKELVQITVPVREVHKYSDGLSQGEVHNRLSALATIVDSRGWAIKNVSLDDTSSDRLVNPQAPKDEKAAVIDAAPDVFDESSGTIAAQFDNMIEKSEQQHKSETLRLVEEARRRSTETVAVQDNSTPSTPSRQAAKNQKSSGKDQDFWFMHAPDTPTTPGLATFQTSAVVAPGTSASSTQQTANSNIKTDLTEEQLLATVHKKQERDALQTMSHHEKVIDPNGPAPTANIPEPKPETQNSNQSINQMTPPVNPDILKQSLAQNNDRSIESLSREVNKKTDFGDDEVVVSLH
jgi:hypothetical protein